MAAAGAARDTQATSGTNLPKYYLHNSSLASKLARSVAPSPHVTTRPSPPAGIQVDSMLTTHKKLQISSARRARVPCFSSTVNVTVEWQHACRLGLGDRHGSRLYLSLSLLAREFKVTARANAYVSANELKVQKPKSAPCMSHRRMAWC